MIDKTLIFMSIFFIFHKQLPDKFCGLEFSTKISFCLVIVLNIFLSPDTQLAVFAAVSDFSRMLDPYKSALTLLRNESHHVNALGKSFESVCNVYLLRD